MQHARQLAAQLSPWAKPGTFRSSQEEPHGTVTLIFSEAVMFEGAIGNRGPACAMIRSSITSQRKFDVSEWPKRPYHRSCCPHRSINSKGGTSAAAHFKRHPLPATTTTNATATTTTSPSCSSPTLLLLICSKFFAQSLPHQG